MIPREVIEKALRGLIADLDYDLHKSLECDEDEGRDWYPNIAKEFSEAIGNE